MQVVRDNKYLKWFIGTIVFLVILVILLIQKQCESERETQLTKSMYHALNDTLRLWKDKDGYSRGEISVIEADRAEAFLIARSKDSTIIKLQKLVASHKKDIKTQGSVTIINTQGEINTSVPTVITYIDTVTKNPVYTADFNLRGWAWGSIMARSDSIGIRLKYRDEFNLVIGREKEGFLGLRRGRAYADLTSKSPFTDIKEMRVYQTALPRNKNFHIGPGLFYGIGTEFKVQPFVGVGVMWTPINF